MPPPLKLCTAGCTVGAQLKRRKHSAARSTCAAAPNVRSSPFGADTVCKSRNSFADALFTQGLMALIQPIVCCVRAQSAREFVTEFSGGATPHRSAGVAQSYIKSSELANQAHPSQPHSRLMMPACMWVVVWLIAAKLHSHHPGHFNLHPLYNKKKYRPY